MSPYYYAEKLESPRLHTRWLTEADIPAWSAFMADTPVQQVFPNLNAQSAEERATSWINRQRQRYVTQGFGLQALIEKDTQAFVGQCGLLSQEVDGQSEIEVGYHIFSEFRGKGYAPEAAKLFIDFALQHRQADSVISIIHTSNTNSQRVAAKNGLVRGEKTIYLGSEVYIYRFNPDADNAK
jgi:ribosomal-protein-alanine N-acetyltransferase